MSEAYQIQIQYKRKQLSVQIGKNATTLDLFQYLVKENVIELGNTNNNNLKFFYPCLNMFISINQLSLESILGKMQNCILELKEDLLQYDSNLFASSDVIPQKQDNNTQPQIYNNLQPKDIQHQGNQQNQTQAQQQQLVKRQQVYTQNAIQSNNQQYQQFQQFQYNHQSQNQQDQQLNNQVQNQSYYQQQQYQQECRQENQTNNQQNKTNNQQNQTYTQQNQKKNLTLQYQQKEIKIDVQETLIVNELFAHFFQHFDIEEDCQLFWEDLQLSGLDQNVSIFVQGIQNNSIIKCKLSQKELNFDIIIEIEDGYQIRTFSQKNHTSLSTPNQIIEKILKYLDLKKEIASIVLFRCQDNISKTQQNQVLKDKDQIQADLYHCTLQELKLMDKPLKLKARVRYNGGSMKGILF